MAYTYGVDVRPSMPATNASASETIFGVVLGMRNTKLEAKLPSERRPSFDIQDYFVGPRDLDKFSKWPKVLRLHGSVLPSMIIPMVFVGLEATAIRCVSHWLHPLAVNQVLLTVMGFVVALALSFRSSTAYERYSEGRKYWAQLNMSSQILARVFWIHILERSGHQNEDLLFKRSGLNLITAFVIALKHRLRHEPYTMYRDLSGYLDHIETFAGLATLIQHPKPKENGFWKTSGRHLELTWCYDNPLTEIKQSVMPLGNLPLEILTYMGAFLDQAITNQQLIIPYQQALAYNTMSTLHDILTGCDRILHTPLALAYTVAIHHITWLYILLLPFQLDATLGWVAIPATILAAYIILAILFIGSELENPFGLEVNDLPLNTYCKQIAADIDIISARPKPDMSKLIESERNKVLFPLSQATYKQWLEQPTDVIVGELRHKAEMMSKRRLLPTSVKESDDVSKSDPNKTEAQKDADKDLEAGIVASTEKGNITATTNTSRFKATIATGKQHTPSITSSYGPSTMMTSKQFDNSNYSNETVSVTATQFSYPHQFYSQPSTRTQTQTQLGSTLNSKATTKYTPKQAYSPAGPISIPTIEQLITQDQIYTSNSSNIHQQTETPSLRIQAPSPPATMVKPTDRSSPQSSTRPLHCNVPLPSGSSSSDCSSDISSEDIQSIVNQWRRSFTPISPHATEPLSPTSSASLSADDADYEAVAHTWIQSHATSSSPTSPGSHIQSHPPTLSHSSPILSPVSEYSESNAISSSNAIATTTATYESQEVPPLPSMGDSTYPSSSASSIDGRRSPHSGTVSPLNLQAVASGQWGSHWADIDAELGELSRTLALTSTSASASGSSAAKKPNVLRPAAVMATHSSETIRPLLLDEEQRQQRGKQHSPSNSITSSSSSVSSSFRRRKVSSKKLKSKSPSPIGSISSSKKRKARITTIKPVRSGAPIVVEGSVAGRSKLNFPAAAVPLPPMENSMVVRGFGMGRSDFIGGHEEAE